MNNEFNPLDYIDELFDDMDYFTPGFGVWRCASKNASCPCGCGDTSVIRFKQYSELHRDWYIMEHFCNECMMYREFGHSGHYTFEALKKYVNDYIVRPGS